MSHLPFRLSRGTRQLLFIMLQFITIITANLFVMFLLGVLSQVLGWGVMTGQLATLITSCLSVAIYLYLPSNQRSKPKPSSSSYNTTTIRPHIQPQGYHRSPRFEVHGNHLHEVDKHGKLTDQLAFPERKPQH